jgi:tRNA-dihydrouridine synthase A
MSSRPYPHRFSVAPMMDLTDRHARFFLRLLSHRALLYTEMITSAAMVHNDSRKRLPFNKEEHPVAFQIGGCDPVELAHCARLVEAEGYDELNLNVGCPSDRVQSGRFGACLMADPNLVAECIAAMRDTVKIPVTVKTRIGIDRDESTDRLFALVEAVRATGCDTFIIHARKAWLDGLSPRENREIPPLRYEVVYELKQRYPALHIVLNGGVTTMREIHGHLAHVDGVMLGREAYYNPYLLATVDAELYGEGEELAHLTQRHEIVEQLIPYIEREIAAANNLHSITRHILGLYQGMRGSRAWRRVLSEQVHAKGAGVEVLREALAHVAPEPEDLAA